jgi:hypothetical protein
MVELHKGDTYEIFPTLKGIDALISDVPYGMGYTGSDFISKGEFHLSKNGKAYIPRRRFNEKILGDDKPFDPAPFLKFKYVALFGAHNYSERLPSSRGWLVWDKKPQGYPMNDFSDADLIWTNQDKPLRIFRFLWQGALRQKGQNTIHLHPTEKPIELMRWIILQLNIPQGSVICDPFMGSGTTGAAAVELGYKFIGIEKIAKYFHLAEKRINQAVLSPALFTLPNKRLHLDVGNRPAQHDLFTLEAGSAAGKSPKPAPRR